MGLDISYYGIYYLLYNQRVELLDRCYRHPLSSDAHVHTTWNITDLVWFWKLSRLSPGQHLMGDCLEILDAVSLCWEYTRFISSYVLTAYADPRSGTLQDFQKAGVTMSSCASHSMDEPLFIHVRM